MIMVSGGTVTGDLSTIKNNFTQLNSEISELSNSWKGSSYDNLIQKADEMISEYNGVLNSEMSAFASACDLYQEYYQIKSSLSSTNSEDDSQLASRRARLSELKTQIEGLLAAAGSQSLSASSTSATVTAATSTSALGTPSYGTFTKEVFRASNGLEISYYLYRPSYNGTTDVSGLPVMLYMHGGGTSNSSSAPLTHGFGRYLKDQSVNPSGMVISPYIKNFRDPKLLPALKELTDYVVSTYKCDTNRISVSGHSYGAMTTYRLINENPNYFAAAMPISGFDAVTDAFKGLKVWAFNGALDIGGKTSNKGAANAVEQINAIGGNAKLHTYQGAGHSYVQDYTYNGSTYESPDGDIVLPFEWAFRQVKGATA